MPLNEIAVGLSITIATVLLAAVVHTYLEVVRRVAALENAIAAVHDAIASLHDRTVVFGYSECPVGGPDVPRSVPVASAVRLVLDHLGHDIYVRWPEVSLMGSVNPATKLKET